MESQAATSELTLRRDSHLLIIVDVVLLRVVVTV